MGTRVYIGRLNYDCRERDLEKFFKGYGRIREVLIKNGFGFVEFDDYRDADDAVYELNGKELLGERVSVEHARGQPRGSDVYGQRSRNYRPAPRWRPGRDKYGPPTRTEYRLIVENLSSRVSWQDLKDYMRQAGEVTYADAHKQRQNEGVVEFANLSDMKTALEKLDNSELNGRKIKLVEDRPKRRRSHSRSRSRSRSSRSRSQSRSKTRSKSPASDKSCSRSKSRSPKRNEEPEQNGEESKQKSKSRSPSESPEYKNSSSKQEDSDKE
ncbi:serine/arginine-rich splicing factor 4-like [Limulus polyphemus]|uniref:Serine/arginine-rich splicing factor 4-like n=1 Tax=Limulus polyphemus TaxID=6850 RepID=A0ABM1TEM0_LIMPO|nr:serine/arginine-rich splicing factor 4-like [Limulus polyphemus]XP_022254326.1 serine/arginine-rich splicing factor 4-like [Limulus polyphemus]